MDSEAQSVLDIISETIDTNIIPAFAEKIEEVLDSYNQARDAWNDSVGDIKADIYGLEKGRVGGYCGDSVKDVNKIFKK